MQYSLADSAGGSFSIDGATGVLALERALDREVQPAYLIAVRASDRGEPLLSSLVNVTVTVLDVNDNPPVFERRDQLATVPEDVGVGTEVLRVYAASKDIGTNAEITYSIRSGNEHAKFHIHTLTGEPRPEGRRGSAICVVVWSRRVDRVADWPHRPRALSISIDLEVNELAFIGVNVWRKKIYLFTPGLSCTNWT